MDTKFYWFIYQAKYSALILFAGSLAVMTLWFTANGVFSVETMPGSWSRLELIGQALMLILMPSYFAMGIVFAQRRSLALAWLIRSQTAFDFTHHVESVPGRNLLTGFVCGFAFSFFNVPGLGIIVSSNSSVMYAIALAQILLWSLVGLLLAARFHVARAFYNAGKRVKLDIFEISNLKPFGQAGLTDALLIVVALAITTLQSFDALFRVDNYTNALLVALPAIAVLMVTPMYSLHRRMVERKNEELQQINERVRAAPKDFSVENVNQLEALLQRRERVKALSSWPIDMSVISRLLLYAILLPLAWLGTALVEMALDRLLAA